MRQVLLRQNLRMAANTHGYREEMSGTSQSHAIDYFRSRHKPTPASGPGPPSTELGLIGSMDILEQDLLVLVRAREEEHLTERSEEALPLHTEEDGGG